MRKLAKASLGLILSVTMISCSNNIVPNSNNINLSEIKNNNSGIVTLNITNNPFLQNNFKIKGVDFSNSDIKKLKLEIFGLDIDELISKTIDWKPGETASFNLQVLAGKNRIIRLLALDSDDGVISSLMGVLDVEAGKNNTGKISYFETVIAQIIFNIIAGSNSNIINAINTNSLRDYIKKITGFDSTDKTFTKLNPSLLDTYLISSEIINNNGNIPSDSFENIEAKGKLKVKLNITGAKIIINDLNSSIINSTEEETTSIDNISLGTWTITAIKEGYTSQSVPISITNNIERSIEINLPKRVTEAPNENLGTDFPPNSDETIVDCMVRTSNITNFYDESPFTYKDEETKFNLIKYKNNEDIYSRDVYNKYFFDNQKIGFEIFYNNLGSPKNQNNYNYDGSFYSNTEYQRDSEGRLTKLIYSDKVYPENSYTDTTTYTDTQSITKRKINNKEEYKITELIYNPSIYKEAIVSVKNYDENGQITNLENNKWDKITVNSNQIDVITESENIGYFGDSIAYISKTIYEYDTNTGKLKTKTNTNTQYDEDIIVNVSTVINSYIYTSNTDYIVNSTVFDTENLTPRTFKYEEEYLSGNKIINKIYYDNGSLETVTERENLNYWKPLKRDGFMYSDNSALYKAEYSYSTCN